MAQGDQIQQPQTVRGDHLWRETIHSVTDLLATNVLAIQYITLYGYTVCPGHPYNVYRLYDDYYVANNNTANLGCSIFIANGYTAKKDVHQKYF